MTSKQLVAVSEVIKARFPNLTVKETIELAGKILEELDKINA